MIGVVSRTEESAAVEEFFQLFKTPWEPFHSGRSYDVILVTRDEVPAAEAKLLLIFGADARTGDTGRGITAKKKQRGGDLEDEAGQIPIYGEVLTFEPAAGGSPCLAGLCGIAGLKFGVGDRTVLRLGYDLFGEIQHLLSAGQPADKAHIPAFELHIQLLRRWMTEAGISFVEIPPAPAGYSFAVCLTHDIDFVGIRRHKFDHTIAGFLYRATLGALLDFVRGRQGLGRLLGNWWSVLSLPLVHLGLAKDFWLQFDAYRAIEKGLSATYYFIPFKHRPGENVRVSHASRRASAYDICDVSELIGALMEDGCEIGVHGIDAWHNAAKGREELARVAAATRREQIGIRMHWLLRDESTMGALEAAGYAYDSTVGYNETVGFRCGTGQVYRPPGAKRLLELPMHIQDGALFFANRLGLSDDEARERCEPLIQAAKRFGGVLTVLWHDRSLGPERFWGDFYVGLVDSLKSMNIWFANAGRVVAWFRSRRDIKFTRVESADGTALIQLSSNGRMISPPLVVRVHQAAGAGGRGPARHQEEPAFRDCPWTGESSLELRQSRSVASQAASICVPAVSQSA